jgi:hypothetical protein
MASATATIRPAGSQSAKMKLSTSGMSARLMDAFAIIAGCELPFG